MSESPRESLVVIAAVATPAPTCRQALHLAACTCPHRLGLGLKIPLQLLWLLLALLLTLLGLLAPLLLLVPRSELRWG